MATVNSKKNAGSFIVGLWLTSTGWTQSAPDPIAEDREPFTAEQLVAWVWEQNPGIAELSAVAEVAVYPRVPLRLRAGSIRK